MKKFAVLPIAALLLAACSESPVGVEMAPQFSNGKDPQGNAFHTLTTPTLLVAATTSSSVTLTWTPSFEALEDQCDGFALANTLSNIEACRNEHFEVFRNGEKVADVHEARYEDTNVSTGVRYTYYVKSMGMEQLPGSQEPAFTYHSLASNVVEVTLGATACAAPSVTSGITGSPAFSFANPNRYTKHNSFGTVTLSGTTENLVGCPGADAEYRIIARNTNNGNVNEEFTMADWASLLPYFTDTGYSVELPITRNNKNIVFEFLVRVGHDDVEGMFSPAATPTVTIID